MNEKIRPKEGVAYVMRDELWGCEKGRGSMRSRIVWAILRREYWVFIYMCVCISGGSQFEGGRERHYGKV